jgi:hypothetical protein
MATELIAAKLAGKREFPTAYGQMLNTIDNRIANKGMTTEIRRVMEALYLYLEGS